MKAMVSLLRRYLLSATAVACAGVLGTAATSASEIYTNTLSFDGAIVGLSVTTNGLL